MKGVVRVIFLFKKNSILEKKNFCKRKVEIFSLCIFPGTHGFPQKMSAVHRYFVIEGAVHRYFVIEGVVHRYFEIEGGPYVNIL